jgi:carbonic anhydrase
MKEGHIMALLDQILEENARFVAQLPESYLHRNEKVSKYPARQLAIYTCMDTRLVDFLEPAMGIARGEAKVIKAAGNMITGPFDEVIRSLMVAVYELGVTEIMVVGHEDCGMQHSTSASLKERMLARGVKPEAIAAVEGVEVRQEKLARHGVARADDERAGLKRARLLQFVLAGLEKTHGAAHIFK